jgi:hypothetical protein
MFEEILNPSDHPPYFPDLVPSDFYLFRKLKAVALGKNSSPLKNCF